MVPIDFDYRKLLKAYMANIIENESITYLDEGYYNDARMAALSADELGELRAIEAEIRDEDQA